MVSLVQRTPNLNLKRYLTKCSKSSDTFFSSHLFRPTLICMLSWTDFGTIFSILDHSSN